ncbi:dickkopf-like protein 1 [Suncus etruscus]|uniref:dickkopf-like protein 1 n=1 Tax=Suncus etruscus TaxID=109475 RepID=UPI002110590A|nr:dickkopf-like protein 1 [Suncus etruscus]
MWLQLFSLLLASAPLSSAGPVSDPGAPETSSGLQSLQSLLQAFTKFFMKDDLLQGLDSFFSPSVDFRALPRNYHEEEHQKRKLGNNTLSSHLQIHKVTDNKTGDVLISEKMVASIEQGDGTGDSDWKVPKIEKELLVPVQRTVVRLQARPRPRMAFWIMRLPQRRFRQDTQEEGPWPSEKRQRLQAIRDGLLEESRENSLEEAPQRVPQPKKPARKTHFLYILRPFQQL